MRNKVDLQLKTSDCLNQESALFQSWLACLSGKILTAREIYEVEKRVFPIRARPDNDLPPYARNHHHRHHAAAAAPPPPSPPPCSTPSNAYDYVLCYHPPTKTANPTTLPLLLQPALMELPLLDLLPHRFRHRNQPQLPSP